MILGLNHHIICLIQIYYDHATFQMILVFPNFVWKYNYTSNSVAFFHFFDKENLDFF